MKKIPILFLIAILVITGCQPSQAVVQTAIAQTQTAAPTTTSTATPIPTDTLTPTSTPVPTATATDTLSVPVIENAHLSVDSNDTQQTTFFLPSDKTFYCFFDLKYANENTVVKGVWVLVAAEGYSANSEIDSAEIKGGDDNYYFNLDRSPTVDAWPVGTYRIDLYVNGIQVQAVTFEVK
jgi:hypothetical protein